MPPPHDSPLPFEHQPGAGRGAPQQGPRRRANELKGREWTRNSISVWSDLRKDAEELALKHPAVFPKALARRCLECFTRADQRQVLDPFSGSGSTLLAARALGKVGIGFEINPDYVALTRRREASLAGTLFAEACAGEVRLYQEDARTLAERLPAETVDVCITSPPYWDVLTQRRSADSKSIRNYGDHPNDLGRIPDYEGFVRELGRVFEAVLAVLRPGAYCAINIMDLRKGPVFYPFHSDLAGTLARRGWIWDDLIIWDRRAEYNNMRPLGYPSVFRINKAHEYVLVMRKPR